MVALAQDSSVASRTLARIQHHGKGWVFVPKDFLDLGDRGAVDVALHRLVLAGRIRRLGRGVYDYPRDHPQLGLLTASTDDVARAIARSTGEVLVSSDATAANVLGLSTQVPARPVYLTDGSSRNVQMGPAVIRFRRAAPSRMVGRDTKAGLAIRALRFLGKEGVDDHAIARLRAILNDDDRRKLRGLRSDAPAWMHSFIDYVLEGAESPARAAARAS